MLFPDLFLSPNGGGEHVLNAPKQEIKAPGTSQLLYGHSKGLSLD
jgi:hypothetical protein